MLAFIDMGGSVSWYVSHSRPSFWSYLGSPPGHTDVHSVVAAYLGIGLSSALLIGVQQGAVLFRQDHRHHHGGATHQSSLGEVRG